jgi:transcriptional regulator with XRE-family HTH domain
MTRRTHERLVKVALSNPKVKKEYDALQEEFALFEEMIKTRLKVGKTQEDVAIAMKTSTSVVGRLETGGGRRRHSPTIETLRKYAKALGCDLKIKFVHHKEA